MTRLLLGGYASPGSTHGLALDHIADGLRDIFDGAVDVEHNVLDRGSSIRSMIDDAEAGTMTLCYLSTSYLAERVPALSIVDLPYLFGSSRRAHAGLDGDLGDAMSEETRSRTGLVPLGYWDNGFRHVSNRLREIRRPQDMAAMTVRLQPNQMHEELFRAFGAVPVTNDLSEGIPLLLSGQIDAQENPLTNTIEYGIDAIHPHVTMTGHVYGIRGVYVSALRWASWTDSERTSLGAVVASAVALQRRDADIGEQHAQAQLVARGTRVTVLTPDERRAFQDLASQTLAPAVRGLDSGLLDLARAIEIDG